jgi:hypothetical protein
MAIYYKVNDSDTGEPRLLFRQNDGGALQRYVGGGDWVTVKAAVDIRWGKGPDA